MAIEESLSKYRYDHYHYYPYESLFAENRFEKAVYVGDHMGGFDSALNNPMLDHLQNHSIGKIPVFTNYYLTENISCKYPSLDLKWIPTAYHFFDQFNNYFTHPENKFQNFVCSFNGSAHVSRKFLTSILDRFGWFSTDTCSKNFSYSVDILDGHLQEYLDLDRCRLIRKFFIGNDSDRFFQSQHNLFSANRVNLKNNIYGLEQSLTSSFLHVVSETVGTSYYPFITEKFLYSVVTRGLFLAYAQPGWHDHLEKFYGFKTYNKIFDYHFDQLQNPVERLLELISMIAKFSVLSSDDWRDLYGMEIDTIEYNYDHFFSKNYLNHLEKFS